MSLRLDQHDAVLLQLGPSKIISADLALQITEFSFCFTAVESSPVNSALKMGT